MLGGWMENVIGFDAKDEKLKERLSYMGTSKNW